MVVLLSAYIFVNRKHCVYIVCKLIWLIENDFYSFTKWDFSSNNRSRGVFSGKCWAGYRPPPFHSLPPDICKSQYFLHIIFTGYNQIFQCNNIDLLRVPNDFIWCKLWQRESISHYYLVSHFHPFTIHRGEEFEELPKAVH